MNDSTYTGRKSKVLPVFTLANWQLRQTWRLLFVAALGMVSAVVLVCAVPLYSRVALTTGLRTLVASSEINSTLIIHGAVIHDNLDSSIAQVDQSLQFNLGPSVSDAQPLHIMTQGPGSSTPGLALIPTGTKPEDTTALAQARSKAFSKAPPQVQLHGFSEKYIQNRVHVASGRLPQSSQDALEIVLTPETAKCPYKLFKDLLNKPCGPALRVGDMLSVASPFEITRTDAKNQPLPSTIIPWKLRVVGIVTLNNPEDSFWHGVTFQNAYVDSVDSQNQIGNLSLALTSSEILAANIDRSTLVTQAGLNQQLLKNTNFQYSGGTDMYWYYPLKVSELNTDTLASLIEGISAVEVDAKNNAQSIQVDQVLTPNDTLRQYESRITLAQIPIQMLLLLIVGMVLLFIQIAIELLVERQSEVVAILRSRGASRRQIFAIFTSQNLALALLVLLVGPFLAIPVVILMVRQIFSASDMGALSLITADPLQTAWDVRWYALAALLATVIVTVFTLFQATRFDVLALRREAARPTKPSIWQRFYLDAVLAILALITYLYTMYALRTGTLDSFTSIELLSPLTLLSSMLFLLSLLLLFLRSFPRIIQWFSHIASKRNGTASMLALAQLSRTPQQAQRVILLLTLTTALTIFSLIFSASQSQRIIDVVNYQVGADLSGWTPTASVYTGDITTNATALQTLGEPFRSIPGITSATLGYLTTVKALNYDVAVKAVDTESFARTAIWSPQYSSTPLQTLMTNLADRRTEAVKENVVPVIVDSDTWDSLRLTEGQTFTINASGEQTITCLPVQKVAYIPTTNLTASANTLKVGGLLVDYQTYATVYKQVAKEAIVPNYVWLRTDPAKDPVSIRTALNKLMDTQSLLFDRQNFIQTMQQDPVTLSILGAFAIGTVTPLLLALLGSLLISWLAARNRLLSFSLLRALGTSPRQIAFLLSWEQCFIYLIMFTLGIVAGVLLVSMVLPSLIMTSVFTTSSSGSVTTDPALLNSFPATQMIFPPSLLLVLGLLLLICLGALLLMVRIISRPSVSQTLRLNVD